MKKSPSRKKRVLLSLLLLCLGTAPFAFYSGLTVTNHTLYSEKVSAPVRILALTDLHSCFYGKSQELLLTKIHEQKPDLIVMSGDIMDDELPIDGTVALLEGLAGQYPCYYVTGNHEFRSGEVDAHKALFRSFGVTVLEGQAQEVFINGQALLIAGVDDPDVGSAPFDRQLAFVDSQTIPQHFNILLSHRPERFERYAAYDFDLVVSGHAHGGQWRIPVLLSNGLLAPHQGFFPSYTNGIFERNGTNMLVSRGLAKESTRIPRIFNPPELVVIDVLPPG